MVSLAPEQVSGIFVDSVRIQNTVVVRDAHDSTLFFSFACVLLSPSILVHLKLLALLKSFVFLRSDKPTWGHTDGFCHLRPSGRFLLYSHRISDGSLCQFGLENNVKSVMAFIPLNPRSSKTSAAFVLFGIHSPVNEETEEDKKCNDND